MGDTLIIYVIGGVFLIAYYLMKMDFHDIAKSSVVTIYIIVFATWPVFLAGELVAGYIRSKELK